MKNGYVVISAPKQQALWVIALVALALLSGCATSPKAPAYLPDEAKAQLGNIGVVAAQFVPGVELHTPPGPLGAAGRRAVNWAGKAASAVGKVDCSGCGAAGLVWLGALVGATVGGALVGGVAGAVDALPADTVREAEAALTGALSKLRLQEELRDRVFQLARRKTVHPVVVLAKHGPSSPDELATYGSLASQEIDSILEVIILTVGLAGDLDVNPPLTLGITGRARLVRVHDGSQIHETKIEYNSGSRIFTEWAANEAELFRRELEDALQNLADQIVSGYLLRLPQEFNFPRGVTVDATGNLFIADTGNHRIRKVETRTGVVTTVTGNREMGSAGDGGPATSAQLASPAGVAVDLSGNLFIADTGNNRVRKVEAGTGVITTVAGTGESGFAGDGGPATSAQLASPRGIAMDVTGNLFIADRDNHRIRRIEAATGLITTVAGTGENGLAGDGGPPKSAQLFYPATVVVDVSGNVFIADQDNHRIRKIEAATGLITTVAGSGLSGFAGDGGLATSAQLASPAGVAVDASGNIFIADTGNHRIRKVEAGTGRMTTIAGTGEWGSAGDGGPATSAKLHSPATVVVDAGGNLFIADQDNHRVRKVEAATDLITTAAGGDERLGQMSSYRGEATTPPPNPNRGAPPEQN